MQNEEFVLPPSPTLYRLDSVLKRTGGSRSFVYAGIREGSFPKPIKIGKRAVAWTAESIDAWITAKIKGDNHED